MIEAIMYFGIGFLFAALIGIALAPLIHDRAVRLTMRRLENSIPQSMAEIQADKDLLRAEFAMSTRRLEIGVEELKEQNTSHLAELGRRSDVINRLKVEREAQKVETLALKTEVEALKRQIFPVGRMRSSEFRRHEPDIASLVPSDSLAVEPERTRANSTMRNEPRHDREVLAIDQPVAAESERRAPAPDRGSISSSVGAAEGLPGFGGPRTKPSVHISEDDQVAHETSVRRTPRVVRSVSLIAVIGAGAAVGWLLSRDEVMEIFSAWTSSSPSVSEQSASAPPAAKTSAEVARQINALARDLADVRSNVEQSVSKEEPAKDDAPTVVEQEDKQKSASAAEPQDREKLAPFPETKPTTIAGWSLLEVAGGTAVVQGPSGVWRVARGDTVPGIGKVDSIVRWGNRWIVATSRGLISTP